MTDLTLKQALKEGRLEEFIKEHENDDPIDKEEFEEAIRRMASQERSREAPGTSGGGFFRELNRYSNSLAYFSRCLRDT
jgi:hypothetical protein